jgi:hypothetical protein
MPPATERLPVAGGVGSRQDTWAIPLGIAFRSVSRSPCGVNADPLNRVAVESKLAVSYPVTLLDRGTLNFGSELVLERRRRFGGEAEYRGGTFFQATLT